MSQEQGTLVVHFNDGTKLAFSAPRQVDRHSMAAKLEEVLKHNQLAIEADGTLILIPLTSIKYAQVVPAPEVLGGSVIKGARLVS